ncbi:tetratricopeptide repeat protein [Alteromonas sp. ASW11-19]|uniref:Tetratricopeptide repeat protein n=1 Tax=Alteromonas salexigens TaxID=2982530 RepID=A0ABT2VP50_9ALTE|nr:tetratricopeptide repeat protein [Alteromonas salexigens]MCU7555091.1 tetratricopeptide repeat protein [Alteromonas salexigens]
MMKKSFKMSAVALVMGFGAAIAAPAAMAQSTAAVVCPGYEKGKTTLVGERTGKKVQRAFEAYNEDKVDEALEILFDIDTSDEFDSAYVGRFIGNLLAAREGEGARALNYLTSAVETKVLNDTEHAQTLKLVGDLSMQEEKYNDAIKWYKKWMDFTCKENPDVYTRMAQAYYESKQLDKIVEPADKAIALYEEPNKNPYVLKLTSFYERKMYPETVAVAEQLVENFPETGRWWTQLGFFYLLVEDFKKGLATFDLAYEQGFLKKENEIKTLAQLYATNGIPFKSAQLMEKYIETGLIADDAEILASVANSYHQAKNYDTAAEYYGKAAQKSSDPEHFQKQGTLLLVAEDYNGAIRALNKALERGAEEPAKIHFSLMEANFYKGDFKAAYRHVQEAKKDRAMRRNASAWEPYIKEKAKNRGIDI